MNEHADRPNCPVCDEEIRQLEKRVAETEGLDRAEALMNLADAAFFDSRWELALAAVNACRDLLPPGEFPRLEADCERKTSCTLAELERFEEAFEHAKNAEAMYSKLGDRQGVATCKSLEGRAALELGRSDEGIELLTDAAKRLRRLGQIAAASQCHLSIGVELASRYDTRAIQHLDTAREGFESAGSAEMVAGCEMEAGLILALEKNMEQQAYERLCHAAVIFRACGMNLQAAQCIDGVGKMLSRIGRSKEAAQLHKEARPILEKMGTPSEVAECDMNFGYALMRLGRSKQAAAKFRAALRAFRKVGAEAEVDAAACEDYLGIALQDLGECEKAEEHHRSAMEVFERHGMARDAEMCRHNLQLAQERMSVQSTESDESGGIAPVIPIRRRKESRRP